MLNNTNGNFPEIDMGLGESRSFISGLMNNSRLSHIAICVFAVHMRRGNVFGPLLFRMVTDYTTHSTTQLLH